MQKMKVDKISKIKISENQTTFGQKYFWCCLKNNIGYRQTNTDLLLEEICVSWQRNSFIAFVTRQEDGRPRTPRQQLWLAQGSLLQRLHGEGHWYIPLINPHPCQHLFWPGEYGEELEKMRFNDESETDYLDCVKFCADLVWHGGFFRTSTNQF